MKTTLTIATLCMLAIAAQSQKLVRFQDRLTKKYGYKDSIGQIVASPQYTSGSTRVEEYMGAACVAVKKDDKWGLINTEGKEITPFRYDNIGSFNNGLADYTIDSKIGLVNIMGKEIIPPKYDFIDGFRHGSLSSMSVNKKYGFIDRTGKEIVAPQYDKVWGFSEGVVAVKLNGKWGFIDEKGKIVIPFDYDNAVVFSQGLAAVQKYGKYGYINKTGKEILPFKYDIALSFAKEGIARVQINGQWDYIDAKGRQADAKLAAEKQKELQKLLDNIKTADDKLKKILNEHKKR